MPDIVAQPGEKLRRIRLYGVLGAKFGREHKFWVSSPAEAVRALCTQVEGFEAHLAKAGWSYAVLVGKRHVNLHHNAEELHEPPGSAEIRIVPVPAGAKRGGLFQAVLGVALIALAFTPLGMAPLTAKLTLGSVLMSSGIGLALGGIAQLISSQPNFNIGESAENRTSKYFSGPAQTIGQGNPVPLFYGEGIIGSVPVSAGIYASDSN